MTLNTSAATARIARQLSTAERATDAAILAAAELMSTLLTARANPEVVVHTGQKAILRLHRAQGALIQGSSDIFRVHDEMSTIGREMGIQEEYTQASGLSEMDDVAQAA
ncbi:MAG: hypothetical protein AB7F98_04095 [Novosphingobium sp.]